MRFRIVLEQPPAGVDFGLQHGRGSSYETIQAQRSRGHDLLFEFSAGVRGESGRAAPDFGGPVVQGPRGQRFVYIDIGGHAGQQDTPWSRRLKVPLTGIGWKTLDRATAHPGLVLEARVPGTGTDGSPSCATVKPFDGWTLERRP